MYIINFKTKGYELTAGNIIHLILNYKLKRLVGYPIYDYLKTKTGKNSIFKKKLSEKNVEGIKN